MTNNTIFFFLFIGSFLTIYSSNLSHKTMIKVEFEAKNIRLEKGYLLYGEIPGKGKMYYNHETIDLNKIISNAIKKLKVN